MKNTLDGCKALVIGCNSEIAAGITLGIGRQNASHVIGTSLPGSENTGFGLDRLSAEMQKITRFDSMALDQTNVVQIREVLRATRESMGGLDVLVTAASRQSEGDFMDMSDEEIERQIAVNLTGPIRVIREAARHMIELSPDGRSRAVGIVASVRGVEPLADHPYDAAKSGLLHWMRAFAQKIGPNGIKIGAIAPGTVDVALEPVRHGCPPAEYRERWRSLTPLGGTPVSVEMVTDEMLALLNSRSVTGETRLVDGGFHNMRPLPQRAKDV